MARGYTLSKRLDLTYCSAREAADRLVKVFHQSVSRNLMLIYADKLDLCVSTCAYTGQRHVAFTRCVAAVHFTLIVGDAKVMCKR